jgi:hypothetical protein
MSMAVAMACLEIWRVPLTVLAEKALTLVIR